MCQCPDKTLGLFDFGGEGSLGTHVLSRAITLSLVRVIDSYLKSRA